MVGCNRCPESKWKFIRDPRYRDDRPYLVTCGVCGQHIGRASESNYREWREKYVAPLKRQEAP